MAPYYLALGYLVELLALDIIFSVTPPALLTEPLPSLDIVVGLAWKVARLVMNGYIDIYLLVLQSMSGIDI